MYDEDNSREIDIREMESVMVVSRYLDNKMVDKLSLYLSINNVVTCIGDGESQILHCANALMYFNITLLPRVFTYLKRFIAQESPAQS